MTRLIACLLAVFSTSASAAGLDDFSTEQLMEEVGRRIDALSGGGGGAGGGQVQLSFSCGGNFDFLVTAISTAPTHSASFNVGTTQDCTRQQNFLMSRHGQPFSGAKLIKVCDGSYLTTVRVTASVTEKLPNAINKFNNTNCITSLITEVDP